MIVQQLTHIRPVKQASRSNCFLCERFEQQRPQNAAKPLVDRNVKADLGTMQHRVRQLLLHQAPEHVLRFRTTQLEIVGQPIGEVYDSVIEKRWPHFQRVRHADAIHLIKDVVRQVVALVKFQEPPQIGPRL